MAKASSPPAAGRIAIAADVVEAAAVAGMVERAASALGPIDILVNNAGIAIVKRRRRPHRGGFRSHHHGQPQIGVPVHAGGAADDAHPQMGPHRQHLSGAARGAGAIGPHYNASKAGMEGLTRGYAARLVKEGITVNAVAPSLIETDMMKEQTGLGRAASRSAASALPRKSRRP